MAKYDALFRLLRAEGDRQVAMSFDEIERLVGPLPSSAHRHQAWINAGREVKTVDRSARRVEFSAPGRRRGA